MDYDWKQLEQLAQQNLSAKRFYHTQCVVRRARRLAERYGCDADKAEAAAWLHDLCKEMPADEQLQWIGKFGIILDSVQKSQPKTWHGMAACGYMQEKLGITDAELLHAVRYHTTACGAMTLLDEVVYLADLTSDDRDYHDIEAMRRLAETATGPAMRYAMHWALDDLLARWRGISRDSLEAYNYYLKFDEIEMA